MGSYVRLYTDSFVTDVLKNQLVHKTYFKDAAGNWATGTSRVKFSYQSFEEYRKCTLADLLNPNCLLDLVLNLNILRELLFVVEGVLQLLVNLVTDLTELLITVVQKLNNVGGRVGNTFIVRNTINKLDRDVSFADEQLQFPAGSFKFQMGMSGWGTFKDLQDGELRITTQLEVTSDLTVLFNVSSTNSLLLDGVTFKKDGMVWFLRFNKNFATGGQGIPLKRITYSQVSNGVYKIVFVFPPFDNSFEYDPDYSVLVGGSPPPDDGEDGTVDGYDGYGYEDGVIDGTVDGTVDGAVDGDDGYGDGTVDGTVDGDDGYVDSDDSDADGATDGNDGLGTVDESKDPSGDSSKEEGSEFLLYIYIVVPTVILILAIVAFVAAFVAIRYRHRQRLNRTARIKAGAVMF